MPTSYRKPTDQPEKFIVEPVKIREITRRGPGRPPAPTPPSEPDFVFRSDDEKNLYDGFIAAIKADYPDLRPSDLLLLPICAAEYVKVLRLLQSELSTGELVTMSRQHPGNMFARFLGQLLGTTRTHRMKVGDTREADEKPWYEALNAS